MTEKTDKSVETAGAAEYLLAAGEWRETLPSGAVATLVPAKGRHLVQAARGAGGDAIKISFGILAATVKIDGRPVTLEDIEDMNLADVTRLMGLVQGNDGTSPASILPN